MRPVIVIPAYEPGRHFVPLVMALLDASDLHVILASDQRWTRTLNYDVTSMPAGIVEADIVFSVGLIEHFAAEQTAHVIGRHFSCVKPGGLVVITFPTPTFLYRITRTLAESAGLWRFPDERPLQWAEVLAEVVRHGMVLTTFTNWPLALTQGVVVARAW